MREILQVEQLASGYGGRDVIGKITFSLRSGELCALLGGNGAGNIAEGSVYPAAQPGGAAPW